MQISLRWLNDYIDLNGVSIETISKTLTSIGLEVEVIRPIKPVSGDLLVGRILKADQHPNADKLRLCQVDVGRGEPLSIVCGAANARQDLRVVVACIGATLPGDFKIKESKIRGEKSFGMLCSEQELGLAESSEGILELPSSAAVGASAIEFLQLEDTIIEIGLTPNRSDCLGFIGLARDLAAKLGKTLRVPEISDAGQDGKLDSAKHVKVSIEDSDISHRFLALYMQDVRAIHSPLWLQRRLQNAGQRPINLIVDATNYVMLESGQPIHAYDERDVEGPAITVRRAKAGEKLVTLDNQERALLDSDIVIADAGKAIGLAGVMGGANSEIKDDTRNIIIEVAHFHPSLIRRTSKRFALHTEASHRFERGTDLENIAWVAKRTAALIYRCTEERRKEDGLDIPLPRIAGAAVDCYPKPFEAQTVTLRLSRLQNLTGIKDLTIDVAAATLTRLGFPISAKDKDKLSVKAPSWRHDIEREVDLIEEVARIHGYDNIPLTLPHMQVGTVPEHPLIDFIDQNKFLLASLGLNETISFPFMGQQDVDALNIAKHPLGALVKLANPIVDQHSHMRSTLAVGLLQAVGHNRRHGSKGARLFEIARSFHEPKLSVGTLPADWKRIGEQGDHISRKAKADDRPIERTVVAGIFDHPFLDKSWNRAEEVAGFFQGKDTLTRWFAALGIRDVVYKPIDAEHYPWLHPGASASLWTESGDCIGYLGELHPSSQKVYDFDAAPTLFEIDLEKILGLHSAKKSYASGTIKFPPVTRDIALVVSAATTYAAFMKSFVAFKRRKFLKEQRLFDVYQGSNMPSGKKSMAFNLTFQAEDRTLTDQDVEKELDALLQWLKDDLSAELR